MLLTVTPVSTYTGMVYSLVTITNHSQLLLPLPTESELYYTFYIFLYLR